MIKKTFGEICDELSIMRMKYYYAKEKGLDFSGQKKRLKMLEDEYFYIISNHSSRKEIDKYFTELIDANKAIWNLENDMRTLRIKKWFIGEQYYIEMGKRAESIRAINAFRVMYKNKLNEIVGDVTEIKVNHLSEE